MGDHPRLVVGRETIYLTKTGFDVIGLDFYPSAIKRARRRDEVEGIDVQFAVDELTNSSHVSGVFELVTDFRALNDMNQEARCHYVQNVQPMTHSGSLYQMFCFDQSLPPDEVKERFGETFSIELLGKQREEVIPR